jgi:MFS family permease
LLCVVPTNHQFIVNPKSDGLNVTDEDIEPGLEESESFYTLTYTVLFLGHAIGSIVAGLLFNYIPTWYLFLCSTLSFIFGYLLYALATNGWMMILARGLAGIQLGSGTALSFAYFGVSFEKYTDNIKLLEKYESKKVARVKKYLFSTYAIGTFFGRVIGIGFPLILAQFPNTPQFRTAGWFCMASGVALLLMQLLLFHGECAWKCPDINFIRYQKKLSSFGKLDCGEVFVKIVVSIPQ